MKVLMISKSLLCSYFKKKSYLKRNACFALYHPLVPHLHRCFIRSCRSSKFQRTIFCNCVPLDIQFLQHSSSELFCSSHFPKWELAFLFPLPFPPCTFPQFIPLLVLPLLEKCTAKWKLLWRLTWSILLRLDRKGHGLASQLFGSGCVHVCVSVCGVRVWG